LFLVRLLREGLVEATTGELRERLPGRIDLCGDCAGAFSDWLRQGRQDGPGEAIGGMVGSLWGGAMS